MTRRSDSITIRDVAHKAGVSVATVSRYLNRNANVSDETGSRIQCVMEELDYVPLMSARHLATRKTGMIGLLSFTVNFEFFGPLVTGLEEALKVDGYSLLMATYPVGFATQSAPPVGPQNTDGVVVFAHTLTDEQLAEWYGLRFPVVLVHRQAPRAMPIPTVNVENRDSSSKLVEHLIEAHGRRRIVFLQAPGDQDDCRWREKGYRAALKAHSIAFDPALVIGGGYDRRSARQTMELFLAEGPPPFDAVFAGDDDLAVSVVGALTRAGLKVPEDVAVVGFDDQRFASLFIPPLTTVHAPTEQVGREAGRQMLNLLQGRPVEPATVLPTEVVIRQSCGCPVAP